MRIVKELFRLAATVWLILLAAVIVDVMTETAEACGSVDCIPTNTPEPTGTLVPTLTPTDDDPTSTQKPDPTKTEEPDDDDDDPTRTPKPTKLTPTPDPSPEPTDEPSSTPDPTNTPEPTVTERPYDCHVDGDGICASDETPTPAIIFYASTPIPPTPAPTLAPTETSMVQVAATVACPNICCCPAQAGAGSEVINYSEAILKFMPIAYMLVGIFGANTLLKTYGTFRKD